MELLDLALGDSFSRDEVMRCIHIGLLCVQEDPADRPTMATIVLTLKAAQFHCKHLNSQHFSQNRHKQPNKGSGIIRSIYKQANAMVC